VRNYDELREQQDNSFTICGETFTLLPCSADQYTAWERQETDSAGENGKLNSERVIERADYVITSLLSAEDVKRWKAVRKRKDGPTIAELSDIRMAILEAQTDLPTSPPESSEAGRSQTVESSKGA
jgi:hypothetical protein